MRPIKINAQHLFAGAWHTGKGDSLLSYSPGNGDCLWRGTHATQVEINNAVVAAHDAFSAWASLSFELREIIVRQFADIVDNNKKQLATLIHCETGKPLWECYTEVTSTVGKIALSVSAYLQRSSHSEQTMGEGKALLTHRPQGVLVVLGPYNFPAHLPNGHIVPALLAGNVVIFKPSELTPMVAEFLLHCWQQAGLPAGVLSLLQGGANTGAMLTQHPSIDGVLFTGSLRTGKILHRQFSGQPQKLLVLEMGGNNPLLVHQCEDKRAAVYTIIQSAFLTAGQRCTSARRLIVLNDNEGRDIIRLLVKATASLLVDCHDEQAFMGPVIDQRFVEPLLKTQSNWQHAGAQLLLEMRQLQADRPLLSPGIVDVSALADCEDEEVFGPLLQVRSVDSFEQAIVEANRTQYGLSAGLISANKTLWEKFYWQSRAGIVNWNRPLTGASGAAPFGGVGASGNYRPSAFYAADYCAHPVASLITPVLSLPDTLSPGVFL
ncbi:MAG: succinylglutamate-semialdehyde dehydrogenase [Spongiibacteraceae bacterium]|nr:succinylglutamate-semialdehyde dehydrogenase [Spongiibacteraceae bacterium]